MNVKIEKVKKLIKDLFFNTFGFGIYMIAQQLILMPLMAQIFPETEFSKIVVYISIFAIITNTLGSELGIVRQVKKEENEKSFIYNKMLLQLLPIVLVISIIALTIVRFNILEIILLTITIILGNVRLYAAAYFRLNKNFKYIVIQNTLYLIGIAIGIGITYTTKLIWLPMLLAELICLIFNLWKTDIKNVKIEKEDKNIEIWKTFKDFSFISFLVNMTTYFDKIIIYPILGDNAISIYYATSSMSKIIALTINPLHGVILSWLKGNDENFKKKVVRLTLKANIPILVIVFIITIPLTYIAVSLLYPQYLESSLVLILPVSIAVAFNAVATIAKAILLKYVESKKLVRAYLIYIVSLIIIAIVMSNLYGLVGFAYSIAISKIILWILFMITLNKVSRKNQVEGEIENEK